MGDMVWLTDEEVEEIEASLDLLDHLTVSLTALTTLPDRVHVEALRAQLPEVRDSLKRIWRAAHAAVDPRGED